MPITIGEIKFPRNSPNFIQNLLSGVKIFEFKIPKIKKIIEITNDQTLGSLSWISGNNPINKNTIKKTIPKFLFVGIFNLFI